MSTRLYPIYQKGNPQLRVFLPNFWMKLVKPEIENTKPNVVQFICAMGMSSMDIKQYLEKIYNVEVVYARTFIKQGRFHRVPRKGYVVKEDDYKVAFVTMPKGQTFKFPDLFGEDKVDKEMESEKKNIQKLQDDYQKQISRNKLRPHVPGWFL